MEITKKTVGIKDYLVYGSGQIINLIVPLLISPFIISKCGIENFGKVGFVTSIFLILSLFIDFGSTLIGVKEISINKNKKVYIRNYLNTVYSLKIIIFLAILFVLLNTIFFLNNTIEYKLYLFSIPVLISQVFNPLWIYQGKEDFKTSNIIIFISKGIYIVSVLLLIKKKEDYVYIIPLLGLANFFTYFIYFIKIHKHYNLLLFSITYKNLKIDFLNTYSILLSNIFISIYINSPIIIVKYILGDYAAGIYKIGDMLLTTYRSYLSVFFNVSFPKFCDFQTQNLKKGLSYLKNINIINIVFLLISSVIIYIVTIIYVSNFSIDNNINRIILFCSKFLFIPILIALNIPFYQMLIFNNQQKAILKIIFLSTIIMLLMCYFLTLKYNVLGTLVSIYISESLTTLLIIIYFYKKPLN
jgi:O-antigen/teichoic acid export membrane protein